jgi:glycosyltransferase involved in cell wall biosynthesis
VVPTRNRWRLLRRTLAGALRQTGVEFEVVVVDDASDTAPPSMPELHDPRVRLIRMPDNRGVAGARNVGIEASGGEWVAFLDDDDLWAPDKLALQVEALVSSGSIWSYGAAIVLDGDLQALAFEPAPPAHEIAGRLRTHNAVPGGGSMVTMRTALLRDLGGYDEDIVMIEDWDLWVRLAKASEPAVTDRTLVGYVRHVGGMTAQSPESVRVNLRRLEEKHRDVGLRADDRLYARWIAGGQRRSGQRRQAARTYLDEAVRRRSPGDLARAIGTLLGERAMNVGSRRPPPPVEVPAWLADYTSGCLTSR